MTARTRRVWVSAFAAALAAIAAAPARGDVVRLSHIQALGGHARLSGGQRGSPRVATGTPVSLTAAAVRLTGTVNPNGRRTTYRFEYGTTRDYGSYVPVPARALRRDRRARRVVAAISGLASAVTYHVRLVATNRRGTSYGRDVTFVTTATTYTNPVGPTFPDPMATLTGVDYYAYGTGTNFPILHSTDLAHWASAGTAFTDSTFPKWSTGNPWAPSVLVIPVTSTRGCPSFDLPLGAPCFYLYYTGRSSFPGGPNCVGVATSSRPDGGFVDQGVLSNGVTTSRGEVGCGSDRGGPSAADAFWRFFAEAAAGQLEAAALSVRCHSRGV